MKTMFMLVKRNIKMFFKDKGAFFGAFVSPAILLVLYITFLGNVYKESIISVMEESFGSFVTLSDKVINGFVAGQLASSLIAVSCVTVAFSTNFLMVQDKANRTISDINVSPVKNYIVSLSYYVASLVASLMVCFIATGACLIYVATMGWYLTAVDVLLLFVDVIILVFFGTALSSVINFFLSTQGQLTAVNMIVGVCYGFLCGAYMPMSEFGEGLQNVLGCLPGTYATSLVRNHAMNGAINAMSNEVSSVLGDKIASEFIVGLRDGFDCNLYFFDKAVETPVMYAVILVTIVVLVALFVLLNVLKSKGVTFKLSKKDKKDKKTKDIELIEIVESNIETVEVAENNIDAIETAEMSNQTEAE